MPSRRDCFEACEVLRAGDFRNFVTIGQRQPQRVFVVHSYEWKFRLLSPHKATESLEFWNPYQAK